RLAVAVEAEAISESTAIRSGVGVGIKPGFRRTIAHRALGLLRRSAPGQPDGALRHAGPNLTPRHERLIIGGEALVNVWMLGNSALCGRTACENEGTGSSTETQRLPD